MGKEAQNAVTVNLKYRLVFWREQEKDIAERKMRVEEPRRRWAENRLATGKAGRRQRGREGWAVGVEGRVLHPRSSCFSPPPRRLPQPYAGGTGTSWEPECAL